MDQVTISRLAPDAWQSYRTVRLAALADSPAAFSSTLARELTLTEEVWRQRLLGRGQFVAVEGGDAVGLAGGIRSDDGQAAELVSMWVDPSRRGRGVGGLLIDAVVQWATQQGFAEVRLWVADGNRAAERAYLRKGFRRTGTVQPMVADDPLRVQFEMVKVVVSFGRLAIGDIGRRWP